MSYPPPPPPPQCSIRQLKKKQPVWFIDKWNNTRTRTHAHLNLEGCGRRAQGVRGVCSPRCGGLGHNRRHLVASAGVFLGHAQPHLVLHSVQALAEELVRILELTENS